METPYVLMRLPPFPWSVFRSVTRNEPPFVAFLRYIEREVGCPLSMLEVAIGTYDHGCLRAETARWLGLRRNLRRFGGYTDRNVDALTVQGATCPVINPNLKPGDVLVAKGAEVAS